jgi:hypothetical protein
MARRAAEAAAEAERAQQRAIAARAAEEASMKPLEVQPLDGEASIQQ